MESRSMGLTDCGTMPGSMVPFFLFILSIFGIDWGASIHRQSPWLLVAQRKDAVR
jgi:hypothetical protein